MIMLIGHVGHPEVVGTMGQLPRRRGDAGQRRRRRSRRSPFPTRRDLAYVTQTTLSVDDTRDVVAALKRRFPDIHAPPHEDICYATTNRQEAIKQAARQVEAVIVVGAANSSNSQRLREVAERGLPDRPLRPTSRGSTGKRFGGIRSLAITAGASAPEILVERILDGFAERFDISVETLTTADESMFFPLPRACAMEPRRRSGRILRSGRRQRSTARRHAPSAAVFAP